MIVEPLSEREREVLEHVSAMESTAEIATEMYISVNTVKTHLKSIYRKLAVTHRGEAVRRAKRLGLLLIRLPRRTGAGAGPGRARRGGLRCRWPARGTGSARRAPHWVPPRAVSGRSTSGPVRSN